MSASTAWFGSNNGEAFACPTCGAAKDKPCVALVSMPGTCVSAGMPLTGIHRERVLGLKK